MLFELRPQPLAPFTNGVARGGSGIEYMNTNFPQKYEKWVELNCPYSRKTSYF